MSGGEPGRRRRGRMSPELRAGYEILKDGRWHNGMALLSKMAAKVPPGEASRYADVRLQGRHTIADKIEIGQRRRAQIRLGKQVREGLWETQPPTMTRAHWSGHAEWSVRDKFPDTIGVPEAADTIGVPFTVLAGWIARGQAPQPIRARPAGERLVTPQLLAVYRKLAEARDGSGKFTIDPRSLWSPDAPTVVDHRCPHCGEPLDIVVSVRSVDGPGQLDTDDQDDAATDGNEPTEL